MLYTDNRLEKTKIEVFYNAPFSLKTKIFHNIQVQ
jgi:hypothetical protein